MLYCDEREECSVYRILIVEDDAVIAGEIGRALAAWGYDVRIAEDLSDVTGVFRAYAPELVLMDVSLPRYNGFYWCAEIRKLSNAPVVFLSSRAENMDVVMGMNLGGDDYLEKPVSMDVLIAKLQAVLRRAYGAAADTRLTLRGAAFDPAALTVTADGARYDLTRNEARILQTLLAHRGEVVGREELLLALWDSDAFVDDNTLSVNVARLRRTLESAGLSDCIVTHKGEGYAIRE